MNEPSQIRLQNVEIDHGLAALCQIAGFYRIPSDPSQLQHQLALNGRASTSEDIVRAAKILKLKSRILYAPSETRLRRIPVPALVNLRGGGFAILGGIDKEGLLRLLDPVTRIPRLVSFTTFMAEWGGEVVMITRRAGVGIDPGTFGFRWFLPSLWRYRHPLFHVLYASFFVQLFALVTPLFFQIVVDKVLVHKGQSTLILITIGMLALGLFNVVLQYLRAYVLSHTTNRIDVELGARLFYHLLRLPMLYFETRAAGQTVARVRELETIRAFLTGQALFSVLDLLFAVVFVAVLFVYSSFLALIVLCSAPVYILIAFFIRPPLREKIKQKFNRGAETQQFLVEAVVGIQTLKSAAIEPMMQASWEEKLAAYVKTSFEATLLATFGQNATQYVSITTTALIIFFGARAVIDGQMTVGELVAFNMIASQISQPIVRLSQLFQDFQQVRVSVERLGDILNTPMELVPPNLPPLPPLKGVIEIKELTFRYRPSFPEVLSDISLSVSMGEVIGIVGPSGSGKSTLTKLIQRLYQPERGQILIDGIDIVQSDPAWLRRQIGVVLQENVLFNRTVHENIALVDPTIPRSRVIALARLSGAHEFIGQMPQGYDTMIEERGANLSGGQRQRIAIARALATNPRILIFDEATSALDYDSERIIHQNMREIVKGRTVFIIAHRLAAVRSCHRIIGLSAGRIVEQGSHEDLVKRENGLYAHLWEVQNGQANEKSCRSDAVG
jgi:subfamily B ATP-binding cassette protein HlyB/CyaB